VFCAGDAVHKHPPSNGLGSNTSIQDSYNLAWKLAAVLRGQAGEALLETYSAERAPVAKQIVLRANQSSREFVQLFEAMGIEPGDTPQQMAAHLESRKEASPLGARIRHDLIAAVDLKNYEFNALGVEFGQHYRSSAVVDDGTPWPEPARDPELNYQPTTHPGARLPHAWVGDQTHRRSTHDLAPYHRFTLITGINGAPWVRAARQVGSELGVPIEAVVIGPGEAVTDLYYDWAKLREVAEDGAILVRPDKHVGWRAAVGVADPVAVLREAMSWVLNRSNGATSDS